VKQFTCVLSLQQAFDPGGRSLAGIAASNSAGGMSVCLSLVIVVVCCQVEVSATDRSLVQRSPTESGVPECDLGTSTMTRPGTIRDVEPWK
jgi:hypothetical protein